LEATAIGFCCAAGYSVENIGLSERTSEEKRKDSIKIVVFSLIALAFAHLSRALFVSQIPSQALTQKTEGTVGGILTDEVFLFTGLLTLACITRIVTNLFRLWKYRKIVKEPENEEQEKKKNKYQITDISNWFLHKEKMDQKKLHKLCYYAYAWYLYEYNASCSKLECSLFKNDFEAWVHGPVSRTLYKKYPYAGMELLEPIDKNIALDKNTIDFLEEVYCVFAKFTGNELEAMTREELPWTNARGNLDPWEPGTTIISNEDMYKQCALLSNTKGE
jgi:uncharacterized phage-associated protein